MSERSKIGTGYPPAVLGKLAARFTGETDRVNVEEQEKKVHLQEENDRLRYENTHDDLSVALNRRGLEEYFETAVAPKAVLVIDGTNFKAINDAFDHERGNQFIRDIYDILRQSTRPGDVIARWGNGDEFVIVLNDDNESDESETDTNEKTRRREKLSPVKLISAVKVRIAEVTEAFLDKNEELQALNVDLAVGGVEWAEGMSANQLVTLAEEPMKKHKEEQHQKGQHRP